jgi:hypothetical protein
MPLVLLILVCSSIAWSADPAEFFENRVRPVLSKNCFACHTTAHLGNLEMVSGAALRKGGNSGPAIVPGDPDKSLLIQAVSHTHPRLKMPPNGQLSAEEIQDLRTWIKAGAVWPESAKAAPAGGEYRITAEQRKFWSFQPVRKPALPEVKDKSWVRTPIDRFILARLEKEGLQPARPAEKHILLRRAYLDLTGLPPTPEQIRAFEHDRSPDAFAKIVDQLLASPHYGERWGRYWLDVARYSDDKLNIVADEPYPNAFRYRDWVIRAMNEDMPYDLFVKSQIAADLLPRPDRERLLPALGFYGMSAQYQEDRPDVTGKAFLGLTVGCAQCHDHKFDPIPTKDYYALLGVFTSTSLKEHPLAPANVVEDYQRHEKSVEEVQEKLDNFIQMQSRQLAEILASRISRYLPAAWEVMGPEHQPEPQVAEREKLDSETLQRWIRYLGKADPSQPYLKPWRDLMASGGSLAEAQQTAAAFQETVLTVHKEIAGIEERNLATLGGAKGNPALAKIVLVPYPRDKYVFWRDLFGESRTGFSEKKIEPVLVYTGEKLDRFLLGDWKSYVQELRAELQKRKKELPSKYPFLHAIEDSAKPANLKIYIRGNPDNLGAEAPRAFLSILSDGAPKPFQHGSGRLELAEAIANPANPLTARVMVNRIWQHHFGYGIVRTPSNFGQLGERPTHPELLDYLAARFVESGWSLKAMHREIMLSATYALSIENSEKNLQSDPDNRLLWRANLRRQDIEVLRDGLLAASGALDPAAGGPPAKLTDAANHRRTVYGFVSRRNLDDTLALFDFPVANDTSEQRVETSTPLQRLFFLNSPLVMRNAGEVAERLRREAGSSPEAQVRLAYTLIFSRDPSAQETRWAREFLAKGPKALPQFVQALFAASEYQMVN